MSCKHNRYSSDESVHTSDEDFIDDSEEYMSDEEDLPDLHPTAKVLEDVINSVLLGKREFVIYINDLPTVALHEYLFTVALPTVALHEYLFVNGVIVDVDKEYSRSELIAMVLKHAFQ